MRRRILRTFAVCAAFMLAAPTVVTAAEPNERRFSADELRADFDELYGRLQASHFNLYARRAKGEYDALFATMRASFTAPMTQVEAQVRFQRFMALGNVAHSNIAFPSAAYAAYRDAGGKAMPVYFRVVNGAARVTENFSGLASPAIGDEILALNGEPMAAWLKRLTSHISADNAYMANTILEQQLPAMLWLELGSVNSFALRVRGASGAMREISIPALSRNDVKLAAERQPKTLELDWNRREARMLPNGVAYLRPGPFFNNDAGATNEWDTTSFATFIDASFRSFAQAGAKSLLIDLRQNPGGDNSFSDLMVSWFATKPYRFCSDFRIKVSQAAIDTNQKRIDAAPGKPDSISHKFAAAYAGKRPGEVFSFDIPMSYPRAGERFAGKVYMLINRHSYSNTVQVAALSQDYKFATILGEETSDLATTYGAMEQFALTRTGIVVGFPKAQIIRANGDVAARGVVPDIKIDTPIFEPVADPVLMRAAAIANGGR
jgi:hypothetical protein